MSLPRVADMAVDTLPTMRDARGDLTVVDLAAHLPFAVVRLFFVTNVPAGIVRGQHGHYRCSQYFLCQAGRLQAAVSDGTEEQVFVLKAGQGLLVRPGIFASETYLEAGTILQVLCDRPYEKDDYIHDMNELRAWRSKV